MTMKPGSVDGLRGGLFEKIMHDSAVEHCTGRAVYVDDIPEPMGMLHLYVGYSPHARAHVVSLDISDAEAAPDVGCVLTASDIPGTNDFGHFGLGDDIILADAEVYFEGQPLFCVAAETPEAARAAAKRVRVDYEVLDPIVTMDEAIAAGSLIDEPLTLDSGDVDAAFASAPHCLSGRLETGAQEQFYLESHTSLAVPQDGRQIRIYASTQDPTAIQHLTARALDVPASMITVETRRMGGAFGGKETGATPFAILAALVAMKTGRPAKIRLDRDDDMIMTGKRHAFRTDYTVAFGDDGRIAGLKADFFSNGGCSLDQSRQVMVRAMYHIDNAYHLPNVRLTGTMLKTNLSSANAFRGFGAPQAIAAAEHIIDDIVAYLGLDPIEVRKVNFYGPGREKTHYDFPVDDFILPRIIEELRESSDYDRRKVEIDAFNATGGHLRRGIALMPVKFGAGFTAKFLNQAGALINIYQDGSISLNHGGTEMGQGLFVKVAQIVAHEFQVDLDRITITATATDKVPNATPTAASSGTDLNGAAAQIAAGILKQRLVDFLSEKHSVAPEQIAFEPQGVRVGNRHHAFEDVVHDAYLNQVQLSAAGFYKNDELWADPKTMKGPAYYYNCYGAAIVEMIVDTLSGESRMLGVDILHDVGRSINPAVDYGQIEGGFMQGYGWLTTEDVVWDDAGHLKTHAPSTYKIPTATDRPERFNLDIVNWSQNTKPSVHRSKAVGEPPVMLGIGAFRAISYAIASLSTDVRAPRLNGPATPERILHAIADRLSRPGEGSPDPMG